MADDSLYFVGGDEDHGNGLHALALDLRGAAAALEVEAPKTLTMVGRLIERNAKRIAGANGSTSIPDTIVGGLRGPLEYRIQAGNQDVAIAGLWELGNVGGSRTAPTFRHPTFGHEPYINQPRHPFLRPALAQDREAITVVMEAMWDRALGPWRLRPEVTSVTALTL